MTKEKVNNVVAGGQNTSVPPWLLRSHQWMTSFNMRSNQGVLSKIPRKKITVNAPAAGGLSIPSGLL